MCRSSQVDAPQGFQYKRCMKLQGKVAVVTGASMGIGEAVAALFVKEGAQVAISSRDLPRAESARQRIASTDRTLAIACDVRRRADLEALLKTTVDRFGRVDIWVNNAGHGLLDSIENMSMADCRAMFDTNLFGAIEAMQLAIPQMKRQGGGTIVNVSSVAGHIAVPYMAAYCATKAALNQMGRAARMELRGTGVNVMTVCPGFVSTNFSANAIKGPSRPRMGGAARRGITAERVAAAVLRGIVGRKREIVVPWRDRAVIKLYQNAPGVIEAAMSRMMRPAESRS
jgi:short-subunit dehydrogenase